MGKRSRKRAGRSTTTTTSLPSEGATTFNGALNFSEGNKTTRLYSARMTATSTLGSTIGGTIQTVFASDPTGTTDWSSISALYQKYRVLGFRVSFSPKDRYDHSNTTQPIIVVKDDKNSTAIASGAAAFQTYGARVHNLADPFSFDWKAKGADLMAWSPTSGSPTISGYVKFYADNCTVSSTYGTYYLEFLVEFRDLV